MINRGIKVEVDFTSYVDHKKYKDLNPNVRNFIKFLFCDIEEEDMLQCTRLNSSGKPDIKIELRDLVKYVSIKSGSQNSVHTEKLQSFIDFLNKINIDNNMIEYLLLYHFGDGTLNGKGQTRLSAEHAKLKYATQIRKFNYYINKHNNLERIINRVLFEGTNKKQTADAIYYGNINYGVWCDKDELLKYFKKNLCYHINTPHFSSLTYQNWCRNINLNRKSEDHRYYVQIKWFSILSDISKIREQSDIFDK